ncbi:MAG: hypothetical protein ACTSUE_13200 [Promethearchaeota archaeon]
MGWFDFLKKKKRDEEARVQEKPIDGAESQDDNMDGGSPEVPVEGEDPRALLRAEFECLMFFDAIYANPLMIVHEEKIVTKYIEKLIVLTDKKPELKETWSRDRKDPIESANTLLSNANAYAKARGMKRSPRKTMSYMTIGITALVFIVVIFLSFIPVVGTSAMYIALCAICIVPNLLKRKIAKDSLKFQEENLGEFNENNSDLLEDVHMGAQDLLDDLREGLVEADLPLSSFKFQLQNSDYRDIKVLNSLKSPGKVGFTYVVKFLVEGEDDEEGAGVTDSDVDFDVDAHVISDPAKNEGGSGGGANIEMDIDAEVEVDLDTDLEGDAEEEAADE